MISNKTFWNVRCALRDSKPWQVFTGELVTLALSWVASISAQERKRWQSWRWQQPLLLLYFHFHMPLRSRVWDAVRFCRKTYCFLQWILPPCEIESSYVINAGLKVAVLLPRPSQGSDYWLVPVQFVESVQGLQLTRDDYFVMSTHHRNLKRQDVIFHLKYVERDARPHWDRVRGCVSLGVSLLCGFSHHASLASTANCNRAAATGSQVTTAISRELDIHGWDYRRWPKRWSSWTSWVPVTEAIIIVFVTTACCYCHLEFSLFFPSVSFSIREEILLHRKCLYVHAVCMHRHAHLCILLKVNV